MKKWSLLMFPLALLAGVVVAAEPQRIPYSAPQALLQAKAQPEVAPMPKAKGELPAPAPKPDANIPTLTAPEEILVDAGDVFTILAKTNCKWVGFFPADPGIGQFKIDEVLEGTKLKVGAYIGKVPKDAAPGTVYRMLIYTGNATAFPEPVVTRIVVPGVKPPDPKPPVPPVPPKPDPKPTPDPVPHGDVSFFIIAEDTDVVGQWRGDILGSPKVESMYKSLRGTRKGAIHRLVDVTVAPKDPLSTWAVKAAEGKKLPYLWLLDAAGNVVKDMPAPIDSVDNFVAAFNVKPTERQFGMIAAQKKMAWKEFGAGAHGAKTPIIPRLQWKPVDLSTFLPPVYDQNGKGQCVASSTCTILEACRAQAGLPYVHLSAGDLYSNINGGRDNGATLEDAMAWVLENGVTTTDLVPYVWNGRRATTAAIVADRKNYMALEIYLCTDFDAAASALQQGFFLEEALTWYNSYMNPKSDGTLPAPGGGRAGGHALAGYGLVQINGKWYILTRNSWNSTWGGSQNGTIGAGNCAIPETNFDNIPSNGFFAIRAVTQTAPATIPFPKAFLGNYREYALAP